MEELITPDPLLEAIAAGPAPPVGRVAVIPPRYEVRGVLGEGGFGVVYDVFDRARGRRVALKTLHRVASDALRRLKGEFRTLVDLRHENVVRLYELGGDGQDLWFTMERLAAAQPFDVWVGGDEPRLRDGLGQLARGLAALHGVGVVHRDLKPSNVLVEPGGRVVLVDFGLARQVTAEGSTQLAGTPLYMAPEQCAEEELTSAVDLYGLGVMVFRILAGRYPFEGRAARVMHAKQNEDAPSLLTLAPDAPGDVIALVDALLARDPAARPSAAGLAARFSGSPRAAPAQRAREEPFVGREAELAQLGGILGERRAAFVRIEGASGIGKSALLDRACRDHARAGAWVLRGRCHPRESVRYKAFDEAIDELARRLRGRPSRDAFRPRDLGALHAVFPVLRSVWEAPVADVVHDRARGLAAVRELFVRLADTRPVVLAIDDLQWGDADSAALLVALLREPDAPALTVVGTTRTGDGGAMLDHLETLVDQEIELRREVLRLGPLAAAEARALAEQLIDDPERASEISDASEGHPLFLAELARQPGEIADLDALILRRIDELSPRAHRALGLLAVAGSPVPRAALERLLDEDAEHALEVLVAAALVRASPEGLRVYHDRISELLVEALPGDARRAIARELAEALHAAGGDLEQVAALYDAAGDRRARALTEEAAVRAARGLAHRRAARLFARALELGRAEGLSREEERRLVRGWAEALQTAGRARDAAAAWLEVAALATPAESRVFRSRAGLLLALGGYVERSLEVLGEVLSELGTRLATSLPEAALQVAVERARGWLARRRRPAELTEDRAARLDALWATWFVLVFTRPALSLAVGATYVTEAQAVDSPRHRFFARCIESCLDVLKHGSRAREPAHAAIARAYAEVSSEEDTEIELMRLVMDAHVAHFGLDIVGSIARYEAVLDLASRHELRWGPISVASSGILSSAFFVLGRPGDVRRVTSRLYVEASERDQLLLWVLLAYHRWWLKGQQAGVTVEARRDRDEIASRWERRGNEMQEWWLRIGDYHQARLAGRAEDAYSMVTDGFLAATARKMFTSRFHHLEGRSFIARAAIGLAEEDASGRRRLLAQAALVARELKDEPSPWSLALALGIEAGVTRLREGEAEALPILHGLVGAADAAGLQLLGALARLELGTAQADPGLVAEGWAVLDDAAIPDPIFAARTLLPGGFRVGRGMRRGES